VAIERVGMSDAAGRRIGAYSKGMRQRIKLAQAIAHDPRVLVLDEPLNGLDPLARAETVELFRGFAAEGRHVVVSSHVLHEVDELSDRVVLVHGGYVVAEGAIEGVRDEIAEERPLQVMVRCDRPAALAARLFEEDQIVERGSTPIAAACGPRTANADLLRLLNRSAPARSRSSRAAGRRRRAVGLSYLIGPRRGEPEREQDTIRRRGGAPPAAARRQVAAMLGSSCARPSCARARCRSSIAFLPALILPLRAPRVT
jgi:ATPase subunit of ABC transporter with duplicated ATPase domains